MPKYALLVDYEYCSGCESCVVACKEEHSFPIGVWGIRVFDDGPWQIDDCDDGGEHFNWNKIPVPTNLCDLCKDRVEAGKDPTCVHHCLADCMRFGTVEEMSALMGQKAKMCMWTPYDGEIVIPE